MKGAIRFRLDNGMRVVAAEDHTVPAVAISFCTDVGVCDEPEHRRGIAHFLEHMMFRGSRNVPDQEHARAIARQGGRCNASTSPDATVYHEMVPVDAIEEVFRLEADRFQQIQLTNEHMQIERQVILEELRAYENQPAVRAMAAVQKRISGDHPYGLSPLGRREDLNALTTADLESFHHTCYRPDRLVAVVCGDIEPAKVQVLAQRYFGPWQVADNGPRKNGSVYRPQVGHLAMRVPMEAPVVAEVYRTDPLTQIDKPALDLLMALMASGESSPIREQLVRTHRLCVEADCVPMVLARGGMIIVFGVFLPPGRHAPRRKRLRQVIDQVQVDLDTDQFAKHVKQFRKDRAHDAYSLEQRMFELAKAELFAGGFETYERDVEALSQVTPQRVQQVAAALFSPDNTLSLDLTPARSRWWMAPVGLAMKIWPR